MSVYQDVYQYYSDICLQVALYATNSCYPDVLTRCQKGAGLESGIRVSQESKLSNQVLFMSPGTLHEVTTTKGPFFVGSSFATEESIPVICRLVKAQLPFFNTSCDPLQEDFIAYARTLDLILLLQRQEPTFQAVGSWLDILQHIQKTLAGLDQDNKVKLCNMYKPIDKIWKDWSHSHIEYVGKCPCGKETISGKHLRTHLAITIQSRKEDQ
jgi:hypothetical protein